MRQHHAVTEIHPVIEKTEAPCTCKLQAASQGMTVKHARGCCSQQHEDRATTTVRKTGDLAMAAGKITPVCTHTLKRNAQEDGCTRN